MERARAQRDNNSSWCMQGQPKLAPSPQQQARLGPQPSLPAPSPTHLVYLIIPELQRPHSTVSREAAGAQGPHPALPIPLPRSWGWHKAGHGSRGWHATCREGTAGGVLLASALSSGRGLRFLAGGGMCVNLSVLRQGKAASGLGRTGDQWPKQATGRPPPSRLLLLPLGPGRGTGSVLQEKDPPPQPQLRRRQTQPSRPPRGTACTHSSLPSSTEWLHKGLGHTREGQCRGIGRGKAKHGPRPD